MKGNPIFSEYTKIKGNMFKDIFLNVRKVSAKVKFSFHVNCRYIVALSPHAL